MTDSKCCFLYFSQTFGDLDAVVSIKPASQRSNIETLRRNCAGDAVPRFQRVDFHACTPDQIPDPLRHLSAALKDTRETL